MALIKKHTGRHRIKVDAFFLCAYFFAVCAYSLVIKPGVIHGHILFFILPGIYLTVRYWRKNYHAFLFSFAAGLLAFPLQIAAEMNGLWDWDIPSFDFLSIAGVRLIALTWYMAWVGFTISAYGAFLDPHAHSRVIKHHKFFKAHYRLVLLCGSVVAGSTFLLLMHPWVFRIPYSYALLGSVIVLVPLLYTVLIHPKLLRSTIKAAAIISIFVFAYEIVGTQAGWWAFNGEYLASLSLFGKNLPIEELILWIGLGSLFVVLAYEEADGHYKNARPVR